MAFRMQWGGNSCLLSIASELRADAEQVYKVLTEKWILKSKFTE